MPSNQNCPNLVKLLLIKPFHSSNKYICSCTTVLKFAVEFYEIPLYTTGGGAGMPNIKPISDLRNYGEVLRDVAIGSPVFLTKNGRGRYAVLDINEYIEYEKMQAWRKLKSELDKGQLSGEEKGWVPADEVWTQLEGRYNG